MGCGCKGSKGGAKRTVAAWAGGVTPSWASINRNNNKPSTTRQIQRSAVSTTTKSVSRPLPTAVRRDVVSLPAATVQKQTSDEPKKKKKRIIPALAPSKPAAREVSVPSWRSSKSKTTVASGETHVSRPPAVTRLLSNLATINATSKRPVGGAVSQSSLFVRK